MARLPSHSNGRSSLCNLPTAVSPFAPEGSDTILARPRFGGTGGGAERCVLSEPLTVVAARFLSPLPAAELVMQIAGCSLWASREGVSMATDALELGLCRPQGDVVPDTASTTYADSAASSLIESLEVYLVAVSVGEGEREGQEGERKT